MNTARAVSGPAIYPPALIRSVIPLVIVWGLMAGAATLAHQPGAVCVTPVAWLIATWTGVKYVYVCADAGFRTSLVGPLVAGLLLGVYMAVVWLLGSAIMTAGETSASELAKARNLNIGMAVASVVFCTLFALGAGWLARYRLPRALEPARF